MTTSSAIESSIKVCVQHPAFPAYRQPIFEALSDHPSMDVEVHHGDVDGIDNVTCQSVSSTFKSTRRLPFGLFWDKLQISAPAKDFDVLVFSCNVRYLSLIPALLRARWNRKGVVLWGHFKSKNEKAIKRLFRNTVARFGSAIICYDYQAKQQLVDEGFAESSIFVAPNSVDIAHFRSLRERFENDNELSELRSNFGLTKGKTAIFTSRLVARKKIGFILEVIGQCVQRDPSISLIVLGDGPEREALESKCKELGIENAVHFLGATFDPEVVALNFAAADVMLYPTNLGLSLMTAAAMGVPTITESDLTKHGPEASWLVDRETAILVPEMTVGAFSEALSRLLDDPALQGRIAENCNAELEARFGVSRMVEGFSGAVQRAYDRSQS